MNRMIFYDLDEKEIGANGCSSNRLMSKNLELWNNYFTIVRFSAAIQFARFSLVSHKIRMYKPTYKTIPI